MNERWAVIALLSALAGCKRNHYIRPAMKPIVETVYASGRITSGEEYAVYALVSGTVTRRLVKDGDTVKKG
ncbi:MAG TPA: hypothetical protein VHE54_20230, partial [Puia sp.]|nr:hypothetical protein [Puia sp.]